MKIIIDAMGGDNAPQEIVNGALLARDAYDAEFILVGRVEEVEACLGTADRTRIEVRDAREVITMEDDPSTATRRKKDSSMTVALNLLRDGEGDAVVSAGSTGALLTGATLIAKRIRGVRRAALAPVIPVGPHGAVLIDCGANAECTPEYLLQFAFLGSLYSKAMCGCENPRIGLLNVGTEDSKGDELRHQTYALLKKAADEGKLNFVGNMEASDVFKGEVEVIVADGFTGNVLLKSIEGLAKFLFGELKNVFYKNIGNKLAALVIKDDLAGLKKRLDPNEVGGTALLGISKPVIKAHGSSKADAILTAVKQAIDFAESGFTATITEHIDDMKLAEAAPNAE